MLRLHQWTSWSSWPLLAPRQTCESFQKWCFSMDSYHFFQLAFRYVQWASFCDPTWIEQILNKKVSYLIRLNKNSFNFKPIIYKSSDALETLFLRIGHNNDDQRHMENSFFPRFHNTPKGQSDSGEIQGRHETGITSASKSNTTMEGTHWLNMLQGFKDERLTTGMWL